MKRKTLIYSIIIVLLILTSVVLVGCNESSNSSVKAISELDKKDNKIGVGIGTSASYDVESYFKKASIETFPEASEGFLAVEKGVVNGYASSESIIDNALASGSLENVKKLDESIGEPTNIVAGISKKCKYPDLKNKFNEFLKKLNDDGTMEDIYRRWITEANDEIPQIDKPKNPSGKLVVATTGLTPPFSFYKGEELTGMDLEIIYRLADYLNADLEIKTYDFFGIITAMETGECDCVLSNLNATPERKESMDFTDPIYTTHTKLVVADDSKKTSITKLEDVNGKNIGVVEGALAEKLIPQMYNNVTISQYQTVGDLGVAVKTEKIDGFITDVSNANNMIKEDSGLDYVKKPVLALPAALGFSKTEKGGKLRDEFNEYYKKIKEDGSLDKIIDKWFNTDNPEFNVDYSDIEGKEPTVKVATSSLSVPFTFIANDRPTGYEIELITGFCREMGYGVKIDTLSFSSIIPSIVSEKYDIASGSISVTEERKESINFSDSIYDTKFVVVTKNYNNEKKNFLNSLKESFNKTFIRENRWKMILRGIKTTIVISFFAALFGTIVGFGLCMLRRMKNKTIHAVTTIYIRILQGTPLVVFLMILFYLVFANSNISGVWTAIIAFSLNFAAYVCEIIRGELRL